MTNDTTTLNGALRELGELMATNLETMGVEEVSADDGLMTLAGKVLDVEPSIKGLELDFDLDLKSDKLAVGVNEQFTLNATLIGSYDDETQEDVDLFGVITGATIIFKDVSNDVVLGSSITNSNGVAYCDVVFSSVGNVNIKAFFMGTENFEPCESSNIEIIISDYIYYRVEEVSYIRDSSTGVYKLYDENMSIDLPTNCEISFDIKCTGGTSSNEHRWYFAPRSLYTGSGQPSNGIYIENYGGSSGHTGRRVSSRSYTVSSFTFAPNTYYSVKLVKTGTSVIFYVNGSTYGSVSNSFFDSYTDWCFFFTLWNTGSMWVKNMVIKEV